MKVEPTPLDGLLVIDPVAHGDARGFFLESYHEARYAAAGIRDVFVQDNFSRSGRGVLRGMHFQRHQAKLVTVIRGSLFDVAVDVRPDSPTFGRWHGIVLDDETHRQFFVPAGFAHGFVVLSEWADVCYKTNALYRPEHEGGVIWNDPEIAIEWPVKTPTLSARDGKHPRLRDIPRDTLRLLAADPGASERS